MKRHQKFQIVLVAVLSLLCMLFTATYVGAASRTITVKVDCERPTAGAYGLGWGYSRLIVPDNGTPYVTFRGMKKLKTDGNLCKAGDGNGAVFLANDRKVWAYTRAND